MSVEPKSRQGPTPAVVRRSIKPVPSRRRLTPVGLSGHVVDERAMLVDYLKLLAWWLGRPPTPTLPPRLEQTLRGLLQGQSEKQIAGTLGISVNTVHDYVKQLHERLGVASRGELLARFLPLARRPSIVASPKRVMPPG